MNDMSVQRMQDQLWDINSALETLRGTDPHERQGEIDEKLTRMRDASQELLSALACNPVVIAGYRADAVDQVMRVAQLLAECHGSPDERQLISLGYACELARDRIRIYTSLNRRGVREAMIQAEGAA